MPDPAGRFSIAFDDPTLDRDVTWTHLDQVHPNLITRYQIDRGRQFELDRTDGGRATVEVLDPDGILDPTNPSGPYYGKLEPLLQARLGRKNPVTDEWFTRFRGFIDEFDYTIDPSQQLGRLTISLFDIYEIVAAIEMYPDASFGDTPPAASAGNVWFPEQNMDDRIKDAILAAGIPDGYRVVFSGNVKLWPTVYSPGESVMTVIQEAADSEFPSVSNVYPDRHGRLCVHGRLAKFDPEGVEAGAAPGEWDFREFTAGDGTAVAAAPTTTAHIRRFAFSRGLAKIINQATAYPNRPTDQQLTAAQIAAQTVTDGTSIGSYGIRSWSAHNLLTKFSLLDDSTDLVETKRFAQFHISNYAQPQNRITEIAFRTMRPGSTGAAATWNLISRVDISDTVTVTVAGPGGGGFSADTFFVEGVHETVEPLNPDYDDVTLTLDLSPRSYFDVNPWAEP